MTIRDRLAIVGAVLTGLLIVVAIVGPECPR